MPLYGSELLVLRTAACLASLVGAFAFATPAVAAGGKPGGGSTSSISLAQPTIAAASVAGWPRYGDFVSFDVSTDATASPFVNLKCYQGGSLVAEGWEGYFDGALGDRFFGLYSSIWTSGAADCTADLKQFSTKGWKQLASTSFHVEA
jgi:hypothetical protein